MSHRRAAPKPPSPSRPCTPGDSFQQVFGLYSSGRWAEAEPLCRALLERQSAHPGGLTVLGIMMARSGRAAQAAEYLGRAAACMPQNPEAHNNHGNALRATGERIEALSCYERALALKPDYAEAHYSRGATLYELGRYAAAVESCDRALALNPRHAAACNTRGAALHTLERYEEALSGFDRAIALAPADARARVNRGAALHKLERYEEALSSYEGALSLDPNDAEAYTNRGASLNALKRFEEALATLDHALKLQPDHAEAHYNRGIALSRLQRCDEALASFDRALALAPAHAAAHAHRGGALRALQRMDEALASCDRALAVDSRCAAAHFNRGVILIELNRHHHALVSLEQALSLGRRDVEIYLHRGAVLEELNAPEAAAASLAQALEADPQIPFLRGDCRRVRMRSCDWNGLESDRAAIIASLERGEATINPFASLSLLDSPALQLRAAEIWVREKLKTHTPLPPLARRPRPERIRIGYFSADLHNHSIARLAAGLIESHDRRRFELTAFSLGPDVHDELRTRVEAAFDRFLPMDGKSDREIAARARELGIDIAVDLGGYTRNAHPGILALRAAPIQVSYLGYLGTLGSEHIDYLFADPVLVPAGSRRHYSEKIAYLPSYQVNDSKRPLPGEAFTRAGLGLPPEGFVFCCFNSSYKLVPETFASWMRILAAVPGSVLYLLGGNTAAESNLRREARLRGIAPERLLFGRPLPVREYLARYRSMDLYLDTLPYNAGTTASDALWAGLPVLTLPGEAFAARMAASILTAAGLPELIAPDRPAYERLAVELATDPRRLADLRQRIEAARTRCALFDTANSTRNIEALYLRMFDRYLAGAPPEHLFLDNAT